MSMRSISKAMKIIRTNDSHERMKKCIDSYMHVANKKINVFFSNM